MKERKEIEVDEGQRAVRYERSRSEMAGRVQAALAMPEVKDSENDFDAFAASYAFLM